MRCSKPEEEQNTTDVQRSRYDTAKQLSSGTVPNVGALSDPPRISLPPTIWRFVVVWLFGFVTSRIVFNLWECLPFVPLFSSVQIGYCITLNVRCSSFAEIKLLRNYVS